MREITLPRDDAPAIVRFNISHIWQEAPHQFGLSYNEIKKLHLFLGQEIERNECHACGQPLPEGVTNG